MPALPQDIPFLKQQGYTDEEIQAINPIAPPQQTIIQSVINRLKAQAGGIGGGGAGAIAGGEVGSALGPIGTIAGGIIGGLGGSYLGQSAQQGIESPDTYAQQQQLSQQAEQEHPIASAVTDIGAGALASGGLPSTEGLSNIIGRLGGKELTDAGKNALLQAALNPAISTGLSLAQGQGLPSIGDIGQQALGGALFSKTWWPHARLGGQASDEKLPEITNEGGQGAEANEGPGEQETMWSAKDDAGRYKINNTRTINSAFNEAFLQPTKDITDPQQKIAVNEYNNNLKDLSVEEKRQMLHQHELGKTVLPIKENEDKDYQGGEVPNTVGGKLEGQDVENDVAPSQHPNPPVFQTEFLQGIIDRNIKKPVAVQRAFPMLKMSGEDATEALRQAQLLANLHIQGDQNATGIREDKGQPSEGGTQPQGSEEDRSNDLVEKTSTGEDKSIPQGESKTVPNPLVVNPVSGKSSRISSPLSDYNRSIELQRQLADKSVPFDSKQKAWQELENLKKGYNGMLPPKFPENRVLSPVMLQHHILSGNATTGTILHSLANTPNHPLQSLAKHLLGAADVKSLGVRWQHDPQADRTNAYRTHYDPTTDRVNISTGSAGDSRVVMEEAIHSLTSKKLPKFKGVGTEHWLELQKYLKEGKNNHIKDLINQYLGVAKHLGIEDQLFQNKWIPHDKHTGVIEPALANDTERTVNELNIPYGHTTKYAMGNLHEFIAQAFKDQGFQKLLDTIPSLDNRTVWQHIVDSVRQLLGLDPKAGNMLDSVLRTGTELVHGERPSFRMPGEYSIQHPDLFGKGDRNYIVTHKPTGEEIYRGIDYDKAHEAINSDITTSTGGKDFGKLYAPPKEQSKSPQELNLPKDKYMGRAGLITRAVVDKVRDIGTATSRMLANHFQQALDKETELKGKWKNAIVQAGQSLTRFDKERLMAAFNAELTTKSPQHQMLTNQAQRQFYRTARQLLDQSGQHRLAIGEPVTQVVAKGDRNLYLQRNLRQDPTYFPGMANQKVTDIYRQNTDQAAISRLDKEFHDYNTKQLGLSDEASQERIDNYKKALQGSTSKSDISHQDIFNGNRKAMGTPLPPTFREQDPVRNLERYFDRAAIDSAHYEHMEKDHNVLAALGQTKDAWGNKVEGGKVDNLSNNGNVKAALHHWKLEHRSIADNNEHSIASLVSSAFISGPALEVHKIVSNVVKSLALTTNPIQTIRAVTYGMSHILSGYNHAVENGVVKLTARSALGMLNGSYSAAEKMQSLASAIRKVSTIGDLTTKVGAGLVQAMNETIIPSKIERAARGDITAQKFLQRLDPNYSPSRQYSQQEVQQLASRSANYIHGTGDIRSLPAWMLNDSEFSGFFSLAHWSIAQTNNFMKEVYEPATRGDIKPLMIGLFGSVIGGYMIQQLRQDISGKKNPIPSLSEIAASDRGIEGNHGLVAYNLIAAMQYTGFGGLLSQVAKYPFDAAYKNNPQGATFPLDEIASDLASTLHNVQSTIANDPNVNWVDLVKAVTQHTLSNDFQLSRIAINQGIDHGLITGLPAEKKELGDKMNQLRRFDMVEGLPYQDIDESSNPYMNIEQKKFKMEQDIPTAIHELPQLVGNIIQTYHASPDVMMSKLKALKQNDYGTFPSLDTAPLSFFKYLGYLQREEGPEAAQQELRSYMTHKIINESKASIVP